MKIFEVVPNSTSFIAIRTEFWEVIFEIYFIDKKNFWYVLDSWDIWELLRFMGFTQIFGIHSDSWDLGDLGRVSNPSHLTHF